METFMLYIKTFLKWLFLSIIMGVVCGIAGTLFHYSVDFATEMRTPIPTLFFCFPSPEFLSSFYTELVVSKRTREQTLCSILSLPVRNYLLKWDF